MMRFERACRQVIDDSYHPFAEYQVEESILSKFLQNKNIPAENKINMLEDYMRDIITLKDILMSIE